MNGFAKSALFLFLALRLGDVVNLAAGMWFVPKYVSPEDIGAVLPVTSFATFLSLPVFAFAMTVMRESARLVARNERGQLKSLLRGVFAVTAAILVLVLAGTALVMPHFLSAMKVSELSVGFLAVAAAFLGCAAPVYTDALQATKRFRALGAIELVGAVVRFAVLAVAMPIKALAGYFAGQAALPTFRIVAGVFALRRDFAVPAQPFWDRVAVRRMTMAFLAVLAYQATPMLAALVEQSVLRTALSAADSAGYYMASRFSDFLHYLTFPLLLVMFPYTAQAAERGEATSGYVSKCSAAALLAAALLAIAYALAGERFMVLMPNGENYLAYAHYMPLLVLGTVLTTCQVFHTNAEVSAGRFHFLKWLVPLHLAYPLALTLAARAGLIASLPHMLIAMTAVSMLRFLFSVLEQKRALTTHLQIRP